MTKVMAVEVIASRIMEIRGNRVMLDRDLAKLYGVSVSRLNEQVKRNIKRFPADFMYQLTWQEVANLKSQFAISSWGGIRKLPRVFTEQGVAMLSSVLNSERAIQVNILIMRTFVQLRGIFSASKQLACKLRELEERIEGHDSDIKDIFEAIRQLMRLPHEHRKISGFSAK
jgi:hypothetical protein